MKTLAETISGQGHTGRRFPMYGDLMRRANDNALVMPGDVLIPDGGNHGSALTGIRCRRAALLVEDIFRPETISGYAREREDLITHCEQLQAANSQLGRLHKEFEDDLLVAARVQQHLQPRPTEWGCVRVETFSQPARSIGGDFGMVCSLDDQHLNLVLGDVSGHGISAALAASHIYAETSAHLQTGAQLGDALSTLNHSVIRKFNSSSFFFTIAAARLDRSGRHMVFAGAGHPPCMIIKPGESPQLLEARSMMLGALSNAVCDEPVIDVDLEPGDRVFLYTDGITEVFDDRGEMLGVEGLQNFVHECSQLPFEEMMPAILERVAGWGHGPFVDDVTLVLAQVVE